MSGVRSYQCWPDDDGIRPYWRHKCKDGVETTLLPKGRWALHKDGTVTPSVACSDCGFHMIIEITHQTEPEAFPNEPPLIGPMEVAYKAMLAAGEKQK